MELNIENAKKAGFKKVIFIIRRELEHDFEELIVPKINMEYEYSYQENLTNIKREKPFGTAHALLTIKDKVKDDFVIINADDYYSFDALKKLYDHLENNDTNATVAYKLKNTFITSNTGNRGVIKKNGEYLEKIEETYNIVKDSNEFKSNGNHIDSNALVSMNIWGFKKDVFNFFEKEFENFLNNSKDVEHEEFLIPNVVGKMLVENINIKVYETDDVCLGITYKEDVELFKKYIK